MKFEIIKNSINDTYWLGLFINGDYWLTDGQIAAALDIPWNTYYQLIRTKDIIINDFTYETFNFKSYKDAKGFIELLEPYTILATLTE